MPPTHRLAALSNDDLPVCFGRYILQEIVGEGGAGRVFRAQLNGPAGFAKPVAIKVLLNDAEDLDTQAGKDLINEARLGVLLRHPNLIDIYELDEVDGRLFLAMELVEGISLKDLLSSRGPLSPAMVLRIGDQICAGLAHAHELKVNGRPAKLVHRDLKPANVLLTRWGQVKIADFGIAKARSMAQEVTDAGVIRGTPAYMSPEQIEGSVLDSRSDIFTLGAVLYELALGRRLFEGEARSRVIMDVLQVESKWQRQGFSDPVEAAIPGLWPVLRRCLRRNPGERFSNVQQVRGALASLLGTIDDTTSLEGQIDRAISEKGPTTRESGAEVTIPTEEQWIAPLARATQGRWHANVERIGDRFIGRRHELDAIGARFGEGARLVTLTGGAGIGKSRLAQEFAARLLTNGTVIRGTWSCDLTEAHTLPGLLHTLATTLKVDIADCASPAALTERIGHALSARGNILVLLDNLEHILVHAPDTVGRWLETAPNVRFLATSRQRLHLEAEMPIEVEPLRPIDAAVLFLDRARAHSSRYANTTEERSEVDEVVRRLEGLPLAIEVAAARAGALEPSALLRELDAQFDAHDPSKTARVDKGATLRSAIEWSWQLLNDYERDALSQCAVFEGGFFMESAEAVIDLSAFPDAPWVMDVIGALLDKSLLRTGAVPGVPDGPRFGMFRSIQAYALMVLQSDPEREAAARWRHARHFAYHGSDTALRALHVKGGIARARRYQADISNLVAATNHGMALSESAIAARACRAAVHVLQRTGPLITAMDLVEAVLAFPDLAAAHRSRMLIEQGWIWMGTRRHGESRGRFEAALSLATAIQDTHATCKALTCLATVLHEDGETARSQDLYQEALVLFRRVGDRRGESIVLGSLGTIDKHRGCSADARARYNEALSLARTAGDRHSEGMWLGNLANLMVQEGRYTEAQDAFLAALAVQREIGDRRNEALWLGNLGVLRWHQGRIQEARALHLAALAIQRETGDRRGQSLLLGNLGDICMEIGDLSQARAHLESAVDLAQDTGSKLIAGAFLGSMAELDAREGVLDKAVHAIDEAEQLLRPLGYRAELGKLLCRRGHIALASGQMDGARAAIIEALGHARAIDAAPEAEINREIDRLQAAMASAGRATSSSGH
jgi:predicted ATPase